MDRSNGIGRMGARRRIVHGFEYCFGHRRQGLRFTSFACFFDLIMRFSGNPELHFVDSPSFTVNL
jgi:hypothetical protein